MGIRETLNKNPAITTGATIAIIVIALIVIVFQMHTPKPHVYNGNKAFFTDDDGQTYFTADVTNIPPFTDKNGLTAVRCYVYKCKRDKPFVGYLEKYTDDAKEKLEKLGASSMPGMNNPNLIGGRLIKKRGDSEWVDMDPRIPANANKIQDIIQVRCSDGSADVQPVNPGD